MAKPFESAQNADKNRDTQTENQSSRTMAGNEAGMREGGRDSGGMNRSNRSLSRGSRPLSSMRNFQDQGMMPGLGQPYQNLRRVVDSLFDEFFTPYSMLRPFGRSAALSPMVETTWPRVDVSEKDNNIVVCAELPGLDKDDINITLEDDRLILRGEKRDEREERDQDYYYQERNFGFFERVIPLPTDVRQEACQADFQNGILTVTLPKEQGSQRRRQISIGGQDRQRGKEKETTGR